MDFGSRKQAQQRIERIRAFREELAELEREQALSLTLEQRACLEAHLERSLAGLTRQFDLDTTEYGKRISWGMRIAWLLGGAAFCAALVLFLHRIWGALPPLAHPVILTAIPLLLLGAAELSHRRGVKLYYVELLVLAAGAGFVMDSNALGSIYNLAPTPHALLGWAGFAVLAAYAYGLRLPLGAGLILLCAYFGSLAVSVEGGFCPNLFERVESILPAAAAIYVAPSLAGFRDRNDFGFVYRVCGAAAGFTAILMLSVAGQNSCLRFANRTIETLYQFAGLVLSASVVVHGFRLGRSGLVNLGAAAFVVFLYVKLHAWWWAWMPKYLFFLLIGLAAVLLLYFFQRLRRGITGNNLQ